MKVKLRKSTRPLITLFILIPMLMLTLAAVSQPQRFKQFAQETFSDPPLYGCLKVGEGNTSDCASKLGLTTAYKLTLHGRPIDKQTVVYYGDRLEGAVTFTNVGDMPIELKNLGLIATTVNKKDIRDFQPVSKPAKLSPRESLTLNNASYQLKSPDPNKEWIVSSKINTASGELPTSDVKQRISVNATCTALRTQELTEKDKNNIKSYCGKNPKSKLCTSRQYCEIFAGKNCTKPNVSEETPGWQCDKGVYLPKPEQDLLEELCKAYPDTDACKNFCDRTYNSSLCPQKYLFVDTKTGKAIKFKHTRAIYVVDPDNYYFEYSDKYPAQKTKMSPPNPSGTPSKPSGTPPKPSGTPPKPSGTPPKTLGAKTAVDSRLLALAGPGDRPGMNAVPPPPPPRPATRAPGPGSAGAGYIPGQGTSMRPAPPPPRRSEPFGSNPRDPKVERNNLRPDPAHGRFYDPSNPNGSLTFAATSEFGDVGYNPGCGSGRGDANPSDDPAGANQFRCCAGSGALREGCCDGQCTVWSQRSKDGVLRDGLGRVCTNDPALSKATNTCSFNPDKEAVRRQTIPSQLQGQGAILPPPERHDPIPAVPLRFSAPGSSPVAPVAPVAPAIVPPVNRGPLIDERGLCAVNSDCTTGFCSQQVGCTRPPPAVVPGAPNHAGFNICMGGDAGHMTEVCRNNCANSWSSTLMPWTLKNCKPTCEQQTSTKAGDCRRANNIPN